LARMAWQLMVWVPFRHLFLKSLSGSIEAVTGEQRLQSRYGRRAVEVQTMEERSWALVTGASEGIGLAMCKVLAEQKFNLIMVSGSEDKLKQA